MFTEFSRVMIVRKTPFRHSRIYSHSFFRPFCPLQNTTNVHAQCAKLIVDTCLYRSLFLLFCNRVSFD